MFHFSRTLSPSHPPPSPPVCQVTVISTSPSKEKEAREALGADAFIVSKDEAAMAAAAKTLDGIIDTVSAAHDLGALLGLIKVRGRGEGRQGKGVQWGGGRR